MGGDNYKNRVIRAPRGNKLNARSWQTEAALRLLMNNLDAEVAERPEELIVYGGRGRAARNWHAYDRLVEVIKDLRDDETLLVQSGQPAGVFPTHAGAPRIIIANGNIVPNWANWEHFNHLERLGLSMYGQMTAGSWIYIGSQGIIQGTYETFSEIGRRHFGGSLSGKFILSGGLGGMGGAQPLAATMNGASIIMIECDPDRIEFRQKTGYLDQSTASLDEALAMIDEATRAGKAVSVGLKGNAAEIFPEILQRGIIPDIVTDQTSAHDPTNGYLPRGWTLERWRENQRQDPQGTAQAARVAMAHQVEAILGFRQKGAVVFDYGNNIRAQAKEAGLSAAFDYPGFVEAYVRPLFCLGKGPFRWVALSGNPEDIYKTDDKVRELIDDPQLHNWLDKARAHIRFQGLPARICWLGLGQRHKVALAFNEMVARGELSAPIVIGRDHMDSGSVASPTRETEGMKDGSDTVSDWPILNALLNAGNGATWVSFHHGGGVGIGFSQHSGIAVVADGTHEAAQKLTRIFWSDPATGVMRHADAGYEVALACAREEKLWLPMQGERPQ